MSHASLTLPHPTVFGEERTVKIHGKKLAYLEVNPDATEVVVLVHGWLDNAASFHELVSRLDVRSLALDLYGHGLSDHAPASVRFYSWIDSAYDLMAFLEALDLRNICLVGHSLGASIASFAAAVAPERIGRLVLLDGLIPFPSADEVLLTRSRQFLGELGKEQLRGLAPRRVPSVAEAVKKRLRASPMPRTVAEAICARGVAHDGAAWHWRWDPRLLRSSPMRLSPGQARGYLEQIGVPAVLVRADGMPVVEIRRLLDEYAPFLPQLQVVDVPTGHYVHAEAVEVCARLIRDHFTA